MYTWSAMDFLFFFLMQHHSEESISFCGMNPGARLWAPPWWWSIPDRHCTGPKAPTTLAQKVPHQLAKKEKLNF